MELKCMGVQILVDLCQIWVWHTFLNIQVSSQNKHGTLLEVVQELTGMELTISKAYITCDGGWFIDGELPLLLLNHHLVIIMLLLKISTTNQSKTHILYFLSSCIIFCAVFHVTDEQGQKICDEKLIGNIQKVSTDFNFFSIRYIDTKSVVVQLQHHYISWWLWNLSVQALTMQKKRCSAEFQRCPGRCVNTQSIAEHTAIELTGMDRPGLLSEVSAVLTEMNCRVNAAEVWTHKRRVACVVYVTDEDTLGPIENVRKLERVKEKLLPIMQGYDHEELARSDIAAGFIHLERRLHQLMLADEDYDLPEQQSTPANENGKEKPQITVQIGSERNYSVINVKCPDRPKLLFDTVCTLTDLKYVVFHATIDSSGPYALQVLSLAFSSLTSLLPSHYIRHKIPEVCPLLPTLEVSTHPLYTC